MNKQIIAYLRNNQQKNHIQEWANLNELQINQFLLGNFKLEKEERLSSLLNSLSSSSILVVQDICSFGKSLGEIFANIEKVVESGHQIISLKEKLDLSLSNGNWERIQLACSLIPQVQKDLFSYVREETSKKR